ncbi:MAG: D-alanyl-D-alanine carboxypeptidase (penicillin-binding protein 5/6) [Gammaproteobacteria bacterium]|jgi:D-alanyl-D-alanine carboxypeptidase (penicillin-binding protein 5/6)
MKSIQNGFVLLLATVLLLVEPVAQADTVSPDVPAPPNFKASSYILIDYHSAKVLAERHADNKVEPASLTKIMTSYVAAEAIQSGAIGLDDTTTVSEKAWRMEGSRMFIEVNKQISVDELLQGIIIQSGNDASVAIAEYVSGSEEVFASVMNQHVKRLGMENSSFANSTGLPDPETYTTARDMAKLAIQFIRDFPNIYGRFSVKEYTYGGISQRNRNRLLTRDPSVDGFKTGHTEAAGYCLVSSAKRGDMRLVAVVMGTGSDAARTEASQALLNYGFRFFETRKIYSADEVIAQAKVWKGEQKSVGVGVQSDLFVTFPRGKYAEISAAAEIANAVEAPIELSQNIGQVVLKFQNKPLVTVPLTAITAVAKGSLFSRLIDEVLMRLE